jgi:phage gp46-like protein
MPGWDLRIDPVTKDYVDDGRGGFQTTETIETMLYHQLQTRRNEWVADPELGCTAHLIPPKDTASVALRRRDAFLQALKEFVDLGLAADLVVEVDRDQRGRQVIRSSIRDVQRGEINLQGLLPFAPGE